MMAAAFRIACSLCERLMRCFVADRAHLISTTHNYGRQKGGSPPLVADPVTRCDGQDARAEDEADAGDGWGPAYAVYVDQSEPSTFAAGADAWLAGIGSTRDLIRQTLVARQLATHLPDRGAALEILDAGCGQGTQAIALARRGHRVTGIDTSDVLLAEAERRRDQEIPAVQRRVLLVLGDLLDLGDEHRRRYHVVCCQGVAMYVPSLTQLAEALASASAPGGVVSLLTRNRAGIAMRAGMSRQWSAALDGFDATRYTNRLGIEHARAHDPAEVRETLRAAGCETIAWYGVRLFTDHWNTEEPAADIDAVIAAEEQAGRRDPTAQSQR